MPESGTQFSLIKLQDKCVQVLSENVYAIELNGKRYRRTVPSREFYVHQWNWDSATHAMGLVYIDEERAYDELESLVSGQWVNGLIAQITFNPTETKYFPGPQFWGTEEHAVNGIVTSGITQPPLLGVSVAHVYNNTKNQSIRSCLIENILPKVIKYHEFLKKFRDPENCGLLTVVHPWESGTDNSPRWDALLQSISLDTIPDRVKSLVNQYRSDDKKGNPTHRPGLDDYYRYMYLVDHFKNWGWDSAKMVAESPFAVKDILFNAIWCRANTDLAMLLRDIGQNSQAATLEAWANQTKIALAARWSDSANQYIDQDVTQGKSADIVQDTIATFIPLWAEAADEHVLQALLAKLADPNEYGSPTPVPTTPLNSSKFTTTKYWRGPAWPITNLFTIEGLGRYPENAQARSAKEKLIADTIKMIGQHGLYEYFDPQSGVARPDKQESALGFGSFSWSAAICLYLISKYNVVDHEIRA